MPREHLERIYVASDVFSMLSRFDTFGMAALEAMAASLPVIVSGNVGAKDLVRDGENGFTVPDPSEADVVADRIKMMLQNDMRDRMGREARMTAGKYSWETAVAETQAVYEEMLAGRRTNQH
jgi:UDP-glucose:(heptosyl)LPS alpha-1,3-glucosyltransferase